MMLSLEQRNCSCCKQQNQIIQIVFHCNHLIFRDLEGNEISYIDEEAFKNFDRLEDLNLGNNIFAKLPTTGLQHLLHLKTFNNPKLREFPSPEVFPKVQKLVLSYAYHCCSFLPLVAMSATRKPPTVHETIIFPSYPGIDMNLWNNSKTENWPQWRKFEVFHILFIHTLRILVLFFIH